MPRFKNPCLIVILALALVLAPLSAPAVDYSGNRMGKGAGNWNNIYNGFVTAVQTGINTLTSQVSALAARVLGFVTTESQLVEITATPTHVDGDTFTVPGDWTAKLVASKTVLLDLAADGIKFNTITSSSFGGGITTVNLTSSNLTANLARVAVFASRSGLWPWGDGRIFARDYGAPSQANLQAALDFISTLERTLAVYAGTYTITSKFKIPANIHLQFTRGALIDVQIPEVAIADLSRAAVCVVTWNNHGLVSGDAVAISGITQSQWRALNGFHTITKIDGNSFSIPVNTSAYTDAYNPAVDAGLYSQAMEINGTLDAGQYQIFTCTGIPKVIFGTGATRKIDAYWFGATSGGDNTTAARQAVAAITSGDAVTVSLPASQWSDVLVVDRPKTTIDTNMTPQSWAAGYSQADHTTDWYADPVGYNVMFVAAADDINFINCRFVQGNNFAKSGFFIWYAVGVNGGRTEHCWFEDLAYDAGATYGCAVIIRTGASRIKEANNYFKNCKAAVQCQGSKCDIGSGDISENNDLVNGGADAAWSIDSGNGNKLSNFKFYRAAGSPISGAVVQIMGASDFEVTDGYIYGLKQGVAIYVQSYGGIHPVNKGLISRNIIDGGAFAATDSWKMIWVDQYCTGIKVESNILRNPATGTVVSAGIGIVPGNEVYNNDVDMGTVGGVTAAIFITSTHSGGELPLFVERNNLKAANSGIFFLGVTTNAMQPIWLKNNTYRNMVVAINRDGALIQNAPVFMQDEHFIGNNFTTNFVNIPKVARAFSAFRAGNFPYYVGPQVNIRCGEAPSAPTWNGTSWEVGDFFINPQPTVGGVKGYVNTARGTISPASTIGNISVGSNGLFVANPAGFYDRDFITIAGVTGVKKIINIIGSVFYLDSPADATVSLVEVVTPDPIWEVWQ